VTRILSTGILSQLELEEAVSMPSVVKSIKVVKRVERQTLDPSGLMKTERQMRREMVEIVSSWILERRESADYLAAYEAVMFLAEAETSG